MNFNLLSRHIDCIDLPQIILQNHTMLQLLEAYALLSKVFSTFLLKAPWICLYAYTVVLNFMWDEADIGVDMVGPIDIQWCSDHGSLHEMNHAAPDGL